MAFFSLFSPGRPREGETVFLGASYCCFSLFSPVFLRGNYGLFFPVFARQAPRRGNGVSRGKLLLFFHCLRGNGVSRDKLLLFFHCFRQCS